MSIIRVLCIAAGCAIGISACKNKTVRSLEPLPPAAAVKEKRDEADDPGSKRLTLDAFNRQEQVDASGLTTTDLKAEVFWEPPEQEEKHKSLLISVQADPRADYLEFAVCSDKDASLCKPSKENPGIFAAENHVFPDAPEGLVTVSVRSCVRPEHAIKPEVLCGEWVETKFQQQENKNEELKKLMVEKYEEARRLYEECQGMQGDLQAYKKDPTRDQDHPNVTLLVDNQLSTVTPEMCKEILASEQLSDLETTIAEDTKAKGKESETGTAVLLALGSVSVVAGLVATGISVVKLKHLPAVEARSQELGKALAAHEQRSSGFVPGKKTWYTLAAMGAISAITGAVLIGVETLALKDGEQESQAMKKLRESLNHRYETVQKIRASLQDINRRVRLLKN